ncbi:MAG: hypothetical protein GY925_14515 [Actinomycetia bacterium]|nr:hypothetical protein [Actinomycetes bacterium]
MELVLRVLAAGYGQRSAGCGHLGIAGSFTVRPQEGQQSGAVMPNRRHLSIQVPLICAWMLVVVALMGLTSPAVAGAQATPPHEHFASDATVSDAFGMSIAVDGSTAVIGAPGVANSTKPGKAYVFVESGGVWAEAAVLTAPAPTPGEGFGYDVDIDDGTVLVGVRDAGGGSAYVFVGAGSTWSHQATLSAGVFGSAEDMFGRAVDLEDDRALVGASGDDELVGNGGAAHLFERSDTSWSHTAKLQSGGPTSNGLFGDAVQLDQARAFVGAPLERDGSFALAGSVYEFDLVSGAVTDTIEPPDRQAFHGFGTSIGLEGTTLVIGANGDTGPAGFDPTCTGSTTAVCNPGSVYLYSESSGTFVLDEELHAPDLALIDNFSPGAQFGLELALDSGRLVVGARYSDDVTISAGRIYVFDRSATTWEATTSFTPADARPGDLFGNDVAIGPADQVLAGAPNDDTVNFVWTPNEGSFTVVEASRLDLGGSSISTPQSVGNVGYYTSLALHSQGHPVVSHHDLTNGDLNVVRCNDPGCVGGDESITSPDTVGNVGLYTSLVLDSQGYPVVSYYDTTNNDLRVLHCNDPGCVGGDESITSPDTVGYVGKHTSLRLDPLQLPVVAYYDESNGDLKVLHCNDPDCVGGDESITSPDTVGNVGLYTSLVLDSNSFPVVSYQDTLNNDLKILHCGDRVCGGPPLDLGPYVKAATIEVGIEPRPIVDVDIDQDGDLDLVVVNVISGSLSLLENDGSGNLVVATTVPSAGRATDVVATDMDGDGVEDLVLAVREPSGQRGVSIMAGDGVGGFGGGQFVPAGPRPHFVAVDDLNGDGLNDIVVSHCCGLVHDANDYLSVVLATGVSTYAAPFILPTGVEIGELIEISDIDGDGHVDLISNIRYSAQIVTWLGDGTGSFGNPQATAISNTTYALVDVDADGADELVVGAGLTEIVVLENTSTTGTASWSPSTTIPMPGAVNWISTGDTDSDGFADLLVTDRAAGTVTVVTSGSTPVVLNEVAAGPAASIAVAVDLRGWGPMDLAVTNQLTSPATGSVTILRSTG